MRDDKTYEKNEDESKQKYLETRTNKPGKLDKKKNHKEKIKIPEFN